MRIERLSGVEKTRLREALVAGIKGAVPTYREVRIFRLEWFMVAPRRFAYVSALFLFVVLGGFSVAAESSLPGNILYGLKVGVSEPLRGALAFTPESKVRVEAKLAERRLEEVTALSAAYDLEPRLKNTLISRAASQAEKFADKLTELEDRVDPALAVELSLRIESRIGSNIGIGTTASDSFELASAPASFEAASDVAEPSLMMAVSKSGEENSDEENAPQDFSLRATPETSAKEDSNDRDVLRNSEERLAESAHKISEIRARIQDKAQKAGQLLIKNKKTEVSQENEGDD